MELYRQNKLAINKNALSIGVSVQTTKFVARNNGIAARQTNNQREFSKAKAIRNRQLHLVPNGPSNLNNDKELYFNEYKKGMSTTKLSISQNLTSTNSTFINHTNNTMKTLKILFIIFLSIHLFTSCKDDAEWAQDYIETEPNVIGWSNFNEGSYWIYQNDITGEIEDTVFSYVLGKCDKCASDAAEIDSSYTAWQYYQNRYGYFTNSNDTNSGTYKADISVHGIGIIELREHYDEFSFRPRVIFRIDENGVINEEFDHGLHFKVEIVEQIEVIGKKYTNLALVTVTEKGYDDICKYWVSKENWVVKKEFSIGGKSYSWSLKKAENQNYW